MALSYLKKGPKFFTKEVILLRSLKLIYQLDLSTVILKTSNTCTHEF